MATGNVAINASMRQNLYSLKQANKLMDETQIRLSTGRQVNSAADNPVNFFMAASLSDRASDIGSQLDAMGQAQSTLDATLNALSSAKTLLDQMKSIANGARDSRKEVVSASTITRNAQTSDASVTNNIAATDILYTAFDPGLDVDASGVTGEAADIIATGDILTLATTTGGETITLTVGAGATMQNLVDAINEGTDDGTVGGITIAETTAGDALDVLNGKLTATIETTGGVSHLKILNETGDTLTIGGTVGDKLGVSAVVGDSGDYTSTNANTFSASTVLFDTLDTGAGTIAADDTLSIKVENTTYTFTVGDDGQTVQDLIDWINDTVPGVSAAIAENDNGVDGLQLYFNQGIDSEDVIFTEAGTTGLLTAFGITTNLIG